MSSLTISITEWRDAQPCSASAGLNTRTLGLPGSRSRAELPVREQRAQQILGGSLGQVVGVEPAEIFAAKDFDQGPLGRLKARCGEGQHRIDSFPHRQFVGRSHFCHFLVSPLAANRALG